LIPLLEILDAYLKFLNPPLETLDEDPEVRDTGLKTF